MNILSGLEKIENQNIWAAFFSIVLFFSPGLAFVFYFSNELFITLDIFKLLLLSISIIAPIFFINLILLTTSKYLLNPDEKEEDNDVFILMLQSIAFSAINLYLTIGIAYFLYFTIKATIITSLLIEFLFLLFFIAIFFKNKKSSL